MRQSWYLRLVAWAVLAGLACAGYAKDKSMQQNDPSAALNDFLRTLTPIKNAASDDQVREYLQMSHLVEDYKSSWAGSVQKNRGRILMGQPYLPDSYWTDINTEIRDTDIAPAFNVWFKHTVSSDLMERVLDAYMKLGKNFPGSPMCTELGKAQAPMGDQWNQLTVLLARQVITKVNTADKSKIDDARAQYAAAHPGWKEQ